MKILLKSGAKSGMFRTFLSIAAIVASAECAMPVELPDLEAGYGPPSNWDGPVFRLSKSYPGAVPSDTQPWKNIGVQDPPRYLNALLNYCLEGNLDAQSAESAHYENQFQVEQNGARKWFHAPWLHVGPHAREFIHGLTDERVSTPRELASTQTRAVRNYAVGFYNPIGGYTFWQVWINSSRPDEIQPRFAEGTVAFKLLFTEATEEEVPWLRGAPVWRADAPRKSGPANLASAKSLRLLQVDVAVRDDNSKCGGWIFGTFHYDSAMPDPNPWRRLRPFALIWGNDEGLKQSQFEHGDAKPRESWINAESPLFQYRNSGDAPYRVFGWAGRANGPVDSPVSSCLSCHSTAQRPPFQAMIPPSSSDENGRLHWFRNLKSNEPFEPGNTSMDFSLQLASGIQNYSLANPQGLRLRILRFFKDPEPVDIGRSGEGH